jgi:hypothetical protein
VVPDGTGTLGLSPELRTQLPASRADRGRSELAGHHHHGPGGAPSPALDDAISSSDGSRILHARPSPRGQPLLIEQIWPAQIPGHQPDRFSCVPGQLIASGCGPAAIRSELPGKRHDLGREPAELRAIPPG